APGSFIPFESLAESLKANFKSYDGHVTIGAIGLYFRLLAPLITDKRSDPAVVALGEDGQYAVSLLSGHLGGANDLTKIIAQLSDGQAVITTATDLNEKPALEVLARTNGLVAQNWPRLAPLARLLAEGEPVPIHDPHGFMTAALSPWAGSFRPFRGEPEEAGLWVDFLAPAPSYCFILRPRVLVVGLGSHREVTRDELYEPLAATFRERNLALGSIRLLATIDRRAQERAFLDLANDLDAPLLAFPPEELAKVEAPNPSALVRKNVGVDSVCEAAALLAAQPGNLLVPKQKTKKVTLAVALIDWTSSAWAQATRPA
ncbi:MAG: cobalamin biosynthesis protein, partial [Deltaproteobacteria bacterium]|nr:cobalamin biosynthesis protein [Deltaproteobacteria bacterium]